ncbi:glycosyltransferase family 4 protein [Methylolobus aquaticus]
MCRKDVSSKVVCSSLEEKRIRVAVVESHPIQYHFQYYQILAKRPNIDVTVLFCWDTRLGVDDPSFGRLLWDVPLLEGYRYLFLRNVSARPGAGVRFFSQINPELVSLLTPENFDVVWVWGYSTFSAWLAVLLARLRGLRVLFRGEATLEAPRSAVRRLVKSVAVRAFLKMVNGVAYSCAGNRRYFEHYGVSGESLLFAACAVDNEFFQAAARGLDQRSCRLALKLEPALPVLLFIGRLDERKRPMDIIQAVEKIPKSKRPSTLFVGDGPLRGALEEYCRRRDLFTVGFAGFRNQSELATCYRAANLLLVVSESDPSPKVINEAMNFGLPTVVSDRVGTAGDLVINDHNGFIVECGNTDEIAEACLRILYEDGVAKRMSEAARVKIKEWSFMRGATAIENWILGQKP